MNDESALYVVTNRGQDVEKVHNLFELIVKKFGIGPLVSYLNQVISDVLAVVNSYPVIVAINRFLEVIIKSMEELLAKLDPIWAAFFPQAFQRSSL